MKTTSTSVDQRKIQAIGRKLESGIVVTKAEYDLFIGSFGAGLAPSKIAGPVRIRLQEKKLRPGRRMTDAEIDAWMRSYGAVPYPSEEAERLRKQMWPTSLSDRTPPRGPR